MLATLSKVLFLLGTTSVVLAHSHDSQASYDAAAAASDPWLSQFGHTADLSFSGVNSYAHLPHKKCLDDPSIAYDIALLGIPFDSAVSYRPGARFGPHALRAGVFSYGEVCAHVQVLGGRDLTEDTL